jgi:mersacidin/lichenicidin family type 2 lantibiotic
MVGVRAVTSKSKSWLARRGRPCFQPANDPLESTENEEGKPTMLVDEILRALRDPEYRAQLTNEVRGALPDRPFEIVDLADSDQEPPSES